MNSSAQAVLGYLHSFLSRHRGELDDDCALLHRFIQAGDGDAFALLMRRHGPMVLGLARRVLGDEHHAEDVFQATFLMLARKASSIRRAESISCWLHGVAFRLALRVRRSHQRRQERQTHFRPTSLPTPLDELTAKELLSILDEELHKLSENYRAPLILCCLEGLSQEEAAKRLGCSAGGVRGRLERGRQRLRARLEKRGLTLPTVFGGALLIAGATSPVPAALSQATLQAARTGNGVSPAVTALIHEIMRIKLVAKFRVFGAAVMLLALVGAGAGMMVFRPRLAQEKTPQTAADDKSSSATKRMDLYGDPLPDGATMRLGTLQRRAVGALLAIAPDGKSIVTVREGKYIRIWDADSGALRETHELPWGCPALTSLVLDPAWKYSRGAVLSPNGRWLAMMGPRVGTFTLWDLHTGKVAHRWRIKDAQTVGPLAFSADGERLAAGGHIGEQEVLRVWETRSGQEIFAASFRGNCPCHCLAFSHNTMYLIASYGTPRGGTFCWEIATGRQVWNRPEWGDSRMILTPEDKLLCPYSRPTALDVATGKPCQFEKMPPLYWDTRAVFSPDGRTLLLSTAQGTIVWDRTRGETVRTLSAGHEEMVFFPNGKSVLCNNGAMRRLDVATGRPLWTDTFAWGHVNEVIALAFSADGRRLVSTSPDGTVRLWDTATGRALRMWRTSPPLHLLGRYPAKGSSAVLAISPDGCHILSAAGERLQLWDAASDKVVRTIVLPRADKIGNQQNIYQAWIGSDGRRGIAWFGVPWPCFSPFDRSPAKLTDKLAVWDLRTGELLSCQQIDPGAEAVSPDRQVLLANGRLLDTASGREIARLEGLNETAPPTFAYDGSLVIGGIKPQQKMGAGALEWSTGLRVWETVTGKPVTDLKTKAWTKQFLFSPSNRLIVTNDGEGVQLRRLPEGESEAQLPLPEKVLAGNTGNSYASSIAFSSCGRRLATGMPDGTILIWDISLPPSKPQRLEATECVALWNDLADADAAKAWRAVWRLADAPQDALTFLRGRIKPYPTAAADKTCELLADLDSDCFEVREAAVRRLKELGLQAEPALRAALRAKPSLEQRLRIEELLAALPVAPRPSTPEELRQLRALIVLAQIATPGTRRLLEDVAQGPPSAALTRQAQAALMCRHE